MSRNATRSRARQRKRAAKEAAERRKEDEAKWVDNKSLYICTFENYAVYYSRYRVQAIKLSDLFFFSDTPVTIFSSGSKSKSNSTELREVAFVDGYFVPRDMGFGVLGSQIVLAGSWFSNPELRNKKRPTPTYILETDPKVETNPRFLSYVIPELRREKRSPYLAEIDGKLYALSRYRRNSYHQPFDVFDPKTKVWAPLPAFPVEEDMRGKG